MSSKPLPLILTLKLDPDSFQVLNQLRQQHFPAERNFLPAHITLFHALPTEEIETIQQNLQFLGENTSAIPLAFPKLRFLGNGVAVEVESPPLIQIRQNLAEHWHSWLKPQDRQKYQPHITIQNKVTADEARQLYSPLSRDWQLPEGRGEGLLLWYYQGGPWELAGEFLFGQ
ncbi:MAG TPA: 2'-5' RNA ligase family protein [Leptolyngbyaceae cyanobacterium]